MIAAVLSEQTALADIRRRGRTDHPYRANLDIVVPLRSLDLRRIEQSVGVVITDLTAKGDDGARELTTISARRGLVRVITLIAQGYRQIGLGEVAAIAGVTVDTAQSAMAQLRRLGILYAPAIGRKGVSMTTYALAPRGVAMLDAALTLVKGWAAAKAKAYARYLLRCKAARARRGQVGKNADRVSPPPTGDTNTQADGEGRASHSGADSLARALGLVGDECKHGSAPNRCAFCRRRAAVA